MEGLRGRPWWQQGLLWLFLWPVLLLVLLWRSNVDRNVKIGATVAATIAFLLIGVLSDETEEDTSDVASTDSGAMTTTSEVPNGESTSTTAEASTTTAVLTTTEATTTTATAPPSQADVVTAAVEDALGDSNRDHIPRFAVTANPGLDVIVTWAINESLTEGLTKNTARREAVDILKAVRETATDYTGVRVEGTYPLVDQYGNSSEERVVLAVYSRETLARFNWDNFNFKNVFESSVADEVWLHLAFEY
jgi:hypothetical protein